METQIYRAKIRRSDRPLRYSVTDAKGNVYWYASKSEARLRVGWEREAGFNTDIQDHGTLFLVPKA